MIELDPKQIKAVRALSNRKILRGAVGSGKSRIALLWFLRDCKGDARVGTQGADIKPLEPRPLYIITTAKKRDDLEWEEELAKFAFSVGAPVGSPDEGGFLGAPIIVDSWNNIQKYAKVYGGTFIFDEQRLVGSGAWVKAFYQIARKNRWVVLTATPGDKWEDYIPVFVANRFYSSKAQLLREHAVYNSYAPYPKVDRWVDEPRLERLRDAVLVQVDYAAHTTRHLTTLPTLYDLELFDTVLEKRWNPWTNEPIQDAGELFRLMRRVSNQDPSRISQILELQRKHSKLIVFYNFDYELEMLRSSMSASGATCAEWNGHKHMPVPTTDRWTYLVQYTAGSEAWNCITSNAMAFYSMTFSWKAFEQSMGRIDRRNTPFVDLYYYVLRNQSKIDEHIWKSLLRKQNFNEKAFLKKIGWDEYLESITTEETEDVRMD